MPSIFKKASMATGPTSRCTMIVESGEMGLVPVGVKVTSEVPGVLSGSSGFKAKDLIIQDLRVGKNSQTANSGEFNHRLLDGRRLFSFDKIDHLFFSVYFFNPNEIGMDVELEVEFDEPENGRSGLLLFAPLRASQYFSSAEEAISSLISGHNSTTPRDLPLVPDRSVEWSAHTQIGGALKELVVLPELLPELESGELSIKVQAYDVDVQNKKRGPQEAPGSRRSFSIEKVDGRFLFVGDPKIWANEIVVLTVENKSVLEVFSRDMLVIMEPSRELSTFDAPRYNDRPSISEAMGLEGVAPGKWKKRPEEPDQH